MSAPRLTDEQLKEMRDLCFRNALNFNRWEEDCTRALDELIERRAATMAEHGDAQQERNQCDGCARGLLVYGGFHRAEGEGLFSCSALRQKSEAPAVPAGWVLVDPRGGAADRSPLYLMGPSEPKGYAATYAPVYRTAPAVAVPPLLTDEQIAESICGAGIAASGDMYQILVVASRAIEAAVRKQFIGCEG